MANGWLRLVTDKPDKPKRKGAGDPIECPKCNSRASIEVRLGRTYRDGKYTAGKKQLRCADCGSIVL